MVKKVIKKVEVPFKDIEETNEDEAHSKYIALVCKALTFTNDLIVSKMEGGHILS